MLDFDDVICLGRPYGGTEICFPEAMRPADLFERLWHEPAARALLEVMEEHRPRVVITTSWLRFLDRPAIEGLFHATGLRAVADALHDAWEAPALRGHTRHDAIERWLCDHYEGEPLVVLDDEWSGTGLKGSRLQKSGCVLLCEPNVGLHAGHLPFVRRALAGSE